MKVLYFHQHFTTPQGSSGIRSYQMAKKLLKSGHEVTIVCGSFAAGKTGLSGDYNDGLREGWVDGIRVIELEIAYSNSQNFLQRTGAFLKYALKSVKIVFKEDYDLLFATTTPLTAAIPGLIAKWFRRKRYIFEVRDLWPELPRAMGVITNPLVLSLMSILEWLAYRNATALVALSPGIKAGVIRRGVSGDRVAMIPNGCDIDLFSPENNDAQWQPEGLRDTDFVALYSGTHGIANGLNNVLDVAKYLKSTGREDIKIVLIGDGKLKPMLIDDAHKNNLSNVIFCDPVEKSRLSMLMNRANVGLQVLANIPAFYYGTSPNKFFDYISSKLAVLTNYPGWVADLIETHDCGLAVTPEDPKAFGDAMIHMADNPLIVSQMASNSIHLAKSTFDRELLSSQFVDWLEKWYEKND